MISRLANLHADLSLMNCKWLGTTADGASIELDKRSFSLNMRHSENVSFFKILLAVLLRNVTSYLSDTLGCDVWTKV